MSHKTYNYLSVYVDHLQSLGRYTFSWSELEKVFEHSDLALKKSLHRLVRKGSLLVLQKGFYIIVPPEYSAKGTLPPLLFIDDYMSFLHRPYYVGLLNAAAMHGAAHQQPQEFYVVISKPARRPINKKGNRLNFIVKNRLPSIGIEPKKTDSGIVKVSGPELTAYDLMYYIDRVGGYDRCLTILEEMAEKLNPEILYSLAVEKSLLAPWQRLGFILENELTKLEAADAIYQAVMECSLYRIPLIPKKEKLTFSSANRWKIIDNRILEHEP